MQDFLLFYAPFIVLIGAIIGVFFVSLIDAPIRSK